MSKTPFLLSLAAIVLLLLTSIGKGEENEIDWLDVASGAVVINVTSQYDLGRNSAVATLSGNTVLAWYTKDYEVGPQSITIELGQVIRLEKIVLDSRASTQAQAVRNFELWTSDVSSDGPFEKIVEAEAKAADRNEYLLETAIPARWLRFDFQNNWGDARYISVTEFEGYGEQVGNLVQEQSLSGKFKSNYDLMRLEQDGQDVKGCYDWQHGTLNGDTDGRTFRFQWREEPPQFGSAIMAIADGGDRFNGFFYENGQMQGVWQGQRIEDGTEPNCQIEGNTIETTLSKTKRAILYGIQFDHNSDRLKNSAMPTLQALQSALSANPQWSIVIEGHTDWDGSDDYNLDLSNRRAASVKAWLVSHGIEADRLNTVGFGESRPVSDNATSQGRALNRRVEVALGG